MTPIKLIVPDIDGMLLSSERFSAAFPAKYGVDPEKVTEFFKADFGDCMKGQKDLKTVLAGYVPQWKEGLTVGEVLSFWFELNTENKAVIEELQRLRAKGVKIVLGTNQEKYRLAYILESRGFKKWVDGVVASCELGSKKPDPRFYQAIEKLFPQISKKEILIFDDKPENIERLRSLGYNAEQYCDFASFQELFRSRYSAG